MNHPATMAINHMGNAIRMDTSTPFATEKPGGSPIQAQNDKPEDEQCLTGAVPSGPRCLIQQGRVAHVIRCRHALVGSVGSENTVKQGNPSLPDAGCRDDAACGARTDKVGENLTRGDGGTERRPANLCQGGVRRHLILSSRVRRTDAAEVVEVRE